MKKTLIILLFVLSISLFSQTNDDRKFLLTKAEQELSSGYIKEFDSTCVKIFKYFPNDSLVNIGIGKMCYKYGTIKRKLSLIDKSINIYTKLCNNYPSNTELNLFKYCSIFSKLKVTCADLDFVKDSKDKKKSMLGDFEDVKNNLEKHIGKLDKSEYMIEEIAEKDYDSANSIIQHLKFL